MLLYVAGKYTGDVDTNIDTARYVAETLWQLGHAVICPHLNTAHFEDTIPDVSWETYLAGDFNMISRCDGLVMVPNWKESKGAKMEHEYALSLDIPIWYAPDYPQLHTTEIRCPEQVQGFREIVNKMYRIHLDKNADYSPANIILTDEPGLVTRLWDKTARLLNLTGFKFQALLSEGFDAPRQPKNEAIDDTYYDLAVYGVIGLLLRKKVWGK